MEFYDDELYHHGILGMKWGVRRFQNSDGSLTNAGAKRYGSGKSIGERYKDYKTAKTRQKNLKKARAAKVEKQKVEAQKVKEAEERQKLIKAGKIKAKDMTNEELANQINRLEQERRLKQLQQDTMTRGQVFVKTVNDRVLTPALTSAGEQFLRKYLNDYGDDVLGKIKDARAKADPAKRRASELEKLRAEKDKLQLQKDIKNLKDGKSDSDKEYDSLVKERDTLKVKKEIEDYKNPKESLRDQNKEKEEEIKAMYLNNPEYQTKKMLADIAKYDKQIDGKYDWSKDEEDKDKNNNGFPDDYEDDDDKKNKK